MVFGQSEEFDERSRISKSVRKFTKQVESVSFQRCVVGKEIRSNRRMESGSKLTSERKKGLG